METLFEFVNNYYTVTNYKDTVTIVPKDNYGDIFSSVAYQHSWDFLNTETTEESYVKNYGNKLSSVQHSRYTVSVVKSEDKVSIKFYEYFRYRKVGTPYFVIKTNFSFFTYNFKTFTMYDGSIKDYHKKRKFVKRIRKTPAYLHPLNLIKSRIYGYFPAHSNSTTEDIEKNSNLRINLINTFLKSIPGLENYNESEFNENLFYKVNLEQRGIKIPNNWNYLIFNYPQPKIKDLRKHKMKYVDALMSINNLNGDKIKKVLHKIKSFNPQNFHIICNFFGKDFILNQKEEDIIKIFEHGTNVLPEILNLNLTKKEILNMYEISKLVLNEIINVNTFHDHIRFYSKLKNFEQVKWKSNNYDSFQKEHLDWTELHGFYTKGNFERNYDSRFVSGIEKPIFINGTDYYPVLLKNSTQYNLESFIQSNCVKGYIARASSIIISLRKGSDESNERATIEFFVSKNKNKIVFSRTQTLGKFNQSLSKEWDDILNRLDLRIDNLCHSLQDMSVPKIKVTCGYKTIEAEGVFNDNKENYSYRIDMKGNPLMEWNKDIENIHSIENNDVYLNLDL